MNKLDYTTKKMKFLVRFTSALIAILLIFSLGTVAFATEAPSFSDASHISIESGTNHSAALFGSDLYVWGDNSKGQLPQTSARSSAKPMLVSDYVAQIALTPERSLVLYNDYNLYAYGVDPITGVHKPGGKLIASNVWKISAIDDFALILKKDGTVWAFGNNDKGQLGIGNTQSLEFPVKTPLSGIEHIAAGADFSFAIDAQGALYGWGNNEFSQLDYTAAKTPFQVVEDDMDEDSNESDVESEIEDNEETEGDGDNIPQPLPEKILSPTLLASAVKEVSAGFSHSVVIFENGHLWTAGDNSKGQLGLGNIRENPETIKSNAGTKIMNNAKTISIGKNHNFVILTDDTILAWGGNEYGELAYSNGKNRFSPEKPKTNFERYFATYNSTFAISDKSEFYSFGRSNDQMTAKNDGASSFAPVKIANPDFRWNYNAVGSPLGYWPLNFNESAPGISNQFINGYENNTFRPKREVSRAEFLKMAVAALCDFDENEDYGETSFVDVDPEEWYYSYVVFAENKKLVKGYEDNTFQPKKQISRAEASVIISNMLNLPEGTAKFSDIDGHWAIKDIGSLTSIGIINGYENGTFRPGNNITRAESAKIISVASGFSPVSTEIPDLVSKAGNTFPDVESTEWYAVYVLRGVGKLI